MKPLPIYIGWDPREDPAYHVCVKSLLAHASIPIRPIQLRQDHLRAQGLFWRPQRLRQPGLGADMLDERPFSTEFAFTRFLIPFLERSGWAVFCDLDFLWRADIAELMEQINEGCAVMCVHHHHEPPGGIKMDGVAQTAYKRKNWSSMVLWNCSHPAHSRLTLEAVNGQPGGWLHGFQWLKDYEIGEVGEEWNWLCGHSSPEIDPRAVHFTQGIPLWPEYYNEPYADEWRAIYSPPQET